MAAKVGDFSLILKLLGGIIIGALLGLYIGENAEGSLKHVMDVVVSLRHIFGQIIFFLVPLVIVGFITPAIMRPGFKILYSSSVIKWKCSKNCSSVLLFPKSLSLFEYVYRDENGGE